MRHCQIHLAIPESFQGSPYRLTKQDYLNAHGKSGGVAKKAAENLGVSSNTVLRNWGSRGLDPAKRITLEDNFFTERYKTYLGNAAQAAEDLGCSRDTVVRRWTKKNLQANKKRNIKDNPFIYASRP